MARHQKKTMVDKADVKSVGHQVYQAGLGVVIAMLVLSVVALIALAYLIHKERKKEDKARQSMWALGIGLTAACILTLINLSFTVGAPIGWSYAKDAIDDAA